MKVFHCGNCSSLVFFENINCVTCGHLVAYLPDVAEMAALLPLENSLWESEQPSAKGKRYRLCQNQLEHNVCNWAVPADDPEPLCRSCRLTSVIPDLSVAGNKDYWYRMEVAKRRLIYGLDHLRLPVATKKEDPKAGLAYEFKGDLPNVPESSVLTGHDEGLITINIIEANDAERERRRMELREPYRTLLGHFRHEIGHYYWDRLIQDSDRLEPFRAIFGDERTDYAEALKRHYDQGARPDWQDSFISTYATSHPWEDWAESWAHYLHMTDSLDTAAACGLTLRPASPDDPALKSTEGGVLRQQFDAMVSDWVSLTYALNNLNRGMGLGDAYPFVLSEPVLQKLRFVHETIMRQRPPANAARGEAVHPEPVEA